MRMQKRFTIFHIKQYYTQLGTANQATLKWKAEGLLDRELKDFLVTHIVGQGAFGKVYFSELADETTEKYAIKSIRKDRLVE